TQLHAMDYDHLYSEFNVGDARQANLLSERDAEITHLSCGCPKGAELRDLKEKDFALEGEKNVLSERVEALKSVAASKEVELTSLSSQVAKLTADLSSFQLSRDELNSKVASLESERDCL
ncbi:hypothetical protein Tco_1581249, partial [Tanacetum coccineum]